ncbi:late embryogenesis abundant protein At1g64065-like [Olea europaea var. sylvestris]|uniref:late embryogenesis abundant protein At1g64065-like n=1 Tax=Olea europaea var. sylvestris TaxID=158386 RepID=UPI000C1D88EA|nr:late embryogenesis abundant protein At1g64065-like [Olea europaea var. sylvestris]
MADQESHLNPLEKGKSHNLPKNLQKSSKCLVYILIIVLFHSIILFVFRLIVLPFKSPKVHISHITIQNLIAPLASLNTTMVAEIQVYNKNFGPFKFQNSSTTLLYRNITIGVANIYEGRVEGRERKRMNMSLQVRANKLLSDYNLNLSSDIDSGLVKYLSGHAKLKGEVRLLKIIKRRRTAEMNCTMSLNLTSQEVQDLLCQR